MVGRRRGEVEEREVGSGAAGDEAVAVDRPRGRRGRGGGREGCGAAEETREDGAAARRDDGVDAGVGGLEDAEFSIGDRGGGGGRWWWWWW